MIVDQYGKPIERQVLREPQTASIAMLHREMASHPARGLTPRRLNEILEAAEQGDLMAQHELFQDMEERDGHVFSELSKRKRAVIKLDWDIQPPRNASKEEKTLTEYAKELLLDLDDLEDMLFDLLDGISHGFACLEIDWRWTGGEWLPRKFEHRPQRWFQTDVERRAELRLRDGTVEGAALKPFGWLVHHHRAMSGYVSRSGLGRVLVWPYLFKHYSVGDLAEFLDIHGLPMRIGKYPANATAEEKQTLWRAVAGIGHNAAGIIPASMAIDFQSAAQGSEKPYEAMMAWCERTQSKAITGSTLTSNAGASGLGSGLAEVHNEVRMDIRDSDCKQAAGTITGQLVYPLLALNKGFGDVRRCPRFVFDTQDADDLKLYAEALPKLVSVGVRIPEGWVHEKLRIPVAGDKDAVLATAAQAAPPEKKLPTVKATALLASLRSEFPDQDAVDGALAQFDQALQPQVEAWLAPAIQALGQAEGAEDALTLLTEENPLVADSVLIDALTRAMFVVELLGADAAQKELES
jgi:phage gp29-like protein